MRVRRLGPGESGLVETAADLFDETPDRAAASAYLSDRRNVVYLAWDGRGPVGFLRGSALRQLHTRRLQMFLYEIAVAPRARRRGVARALIEQLLEYCERREFDEVFVFTSPSNRAAVALYRSTGAVTETDEDRMYVYQLAKNRRVHPPPAKN
ncbi:MAG TPA: GNAT family N-acetyltransferase [Thermoplasmata archaeon]|nr:GNAT family N-acetyltransferase [Thermoplasmata archaeon]